MGDVIDMQSRQRVETSSGDRASAEARRATALRNALANKLPFKGDDPRRTAANFHALLEQFEAEGRLSKLDVVVKAGLCNHTSVDSTKRLDTYTCPEGASEERIGRLARKAGKYFKFAEVVAEMTGESVNSLLCRLFEGCSFGTTAASGPDWDEDRWIRLANLIEAMSRRVIRDTNLEHYWLEVSTVPGLFDVRNMSFRIAPTSIGYGAADGGLAGMIQYSDEIAPVPSIAILRRMQGPKSTGWISLDGGDFEKVEVVLLLEIRLALAPTNAAVKVGPLLEFRSLLEAIHPVLGRIWFNNPFTDEGGATEARTKTGCFRTDGVAWDDLDEVPPAERRDICEHSYFAWEELSPALLREMFTFDPMKFPDRDDGELLGYCLINREGEFPASETPPNPFAWGEPATNFYADLLTGRIEEELAAVCHQLISALEAHKTELSVQIAAAEAAALSRWASVGGMEEVERDPG